MRKNCKKEKCEDKKEKYEDKGHKIPLLRWCSTKEIFKKFGTIFRQNIVSYSTVTR